VADPRGDAIHKCWNERVGNERQAHPRSYQKALANSDIEADGPLTWEVMHRCLERFAPRQRSYQAVESSRD
jgi:hypothetical protein